MTTEKKTPTAVEKPSLPAKVKERLYPAVLDLFSQHDFHQVNLREIYRRSGISPSTIYKYFPSKEALLFAILDEKITEVGRLAEIHIKGIESTREIFRKIFWVTLDFYDQNPGVAITAFITVPMRTWMREQSYIRPAGPHGPVFHVLLPADPHVVLPGHEMETGGHPPRVLSHVLENRLGRGRAAAGPYGLTGR
jgi:AcrR family transcriptional regulator